MALWSTRRQVREQPFTRYDETGLQELLRSLEEKMQGLCDEYLWKMGEHVRDIGTMWPSDVHRLQQIRRMNRVLAAMRKRIAQAAGRSEKEIEDVFREIAQTDVRMEKRILGQPDAGSVTENEYLSRILRAQARETQGRLRNLANTTVASEGYQRLIDRAVSAVASGVEDYGSAIRRALRDAGSEGLRIRADGTRAVEYASGRTVRLDSAVRQSVLDGVRHLNQSIMEEVGREFGADGVEIDAHMLCAEDHLPYQGGQYTNEEFEEIQDSLARPFGEWNCRHSWHPILMGISPKAYTPEQLREMEEYSREEIEIDGRTKTRYEWSQAMRRMETAIRREKDIATLAEAAGDKAQELRSKRAVPAMTAEYGRIANKAGIRPEFGRTYVSGYRDAKDGVAAAIRNTYSSVSYNEKATYHVDFPDYDPLVNKGLDIAMKSVAQLGTETGYEHMYLVNLKTGDYSFHETNNDPDSVGYEFRSYLLAHKGEQFAFVHNHNTDSSLSERDMTTLLGTQQISVMIAVRNDGVVYVAERTGDAVKPGNLDERYKDDLKDLNEKCRNGIITPAQRTKDEDRQNNLIRKHRDGAFEKRRAAYEADQSDEGGDRRRDDTVLCSLRANVHDARLQQLLFPITYGFPIPGDDVIYIIPGGLHVGSNG